MQTMAINKNMTAGISCATAGLSTPNVFFPDAVSVYARERSDLIEHCEQLRSANSRLRMCRKEFDDDMAVAARVQRLLEPRPTVWGRVRVDTFSRSASAVGGDFGMVCALDDERLNLVVGDVSGHGISAALAANCIRTMTNAHLHAGAPLCDMLSRVNRSVIQNFNSSSFFFTLAAARLDRSGRHLSFAGAGHPPCMVIKPRAVPQLLEARSMMLGALQNAVCHEPVVEVDLNPGDRILLYTDGITDVFDERGEMLGVEGLQSLARESSVMPFDEMLSDILERVEGWRQGPICDDMTLILAEVLE